MLISIQPEHALFKQAMEIYQDAFPKEIQEPKSVFLKSFKMNQSMPNFFHFLCLLDEQEQLLGFSSLHYLKSQHIAYIVYIVIHPEHQGSGLGRKMMNEIFQYINQLHQHNQPTSFILECEQDDQLESPLEPFYNKFDFIQSNIHYVQPDLTHQDQHVPMNLFVKNAPSLHAIKEIYFHKYHYCNEIDKDVLISLMKSF